MKTRITRRYLAGLIDGEGYVSIKSIDRWKRRFYAPVVKMALTEKTGYLLFEIKELLGGHVYKRTSKNDKHNDSFYWDVHTWKQAEKVIDYIRPYLILKRKQADLVWELIKTKQKLLQKEKGNEFAKIPLQVLQKRQRLYNLVKELNQRGRVTAETKCETPTNEGEVIVRSSEKSEEVVRNGNSLDSPVLCQI